MNSRLSTKALYFFLLLLACPMSQGSPAGALIKKGDVLDRAFRPDEALKYYLPAETLEPGNALLLVRIARQYRYLMSDSTRQDEQLRLGGIALAYAQQAATLAPNNSEAQLCPAITYGKMLPFLGTKDQIAATPRIKEAADRAILLDPRNDLAWYVLGRWHQVLADVGMLKHAMGQILYGNLPTSTNEEAVNCFRQAIEINPRRLRNYIELGRTYAQMGQSTEARRFIEQGLAMRNVEKDDPELKSRGRESLARLP